MRPSFDTSRSRNRGFTLIELLVVTGVAGVMLAAFTAFYLSEQRALRHHQVEIEISQALRTALEQMSRDLRSARRDITRDYLVGTGGANPTFTNWTTSQVEFELDANDDGDKADAGEHKGFRLNGSRVEQYDDGSGNWMTLADFADTLTFTYLACDGAAATTAHDIAVIKINLTMRGPSVGGLPISRTETEEVRLRNLHCS